MAPDSPKTPVKTLKKKLTTDDFAIRDCKRGDQHFLAGAAYLEMALAASRMVSGDPSTAHISQFRWENPLLLANVGRVLQIVLSQNGSQIQFCTVDQTRKWVHASGSLQKGASVLKSGIFATPSADHTGAPLSMTEVYTQIRQAGLDYGPSFQSIVEFRQTAQNIKARLKLPANAQATFSRFSLHPCLLEGVLQTAALGLSLQNQSPLVMPNFIEDLHLHRPITSEVEVQMAFSNSQSCRLVVIDDQGQVCLSVARLAFPQVQPQQPAQIAETDLAFHAYKPSWVTANLAEKANLAEVKDVLVFAHEDQSFEALKKQLQASDRASDHHLIWIKPGKMFRQISEDSYQIKPDSDASFKKLVEAMQDRRLQPSHVLFLWPAHHRQSIDPTQDSWPTDLAKSLDLGLRALFHLHQILLTLKSKQPVHIVTLYRSDLTNGQPEHQAIAAYARTAGAEHPLFRHTLVHLQSSDSSHDDVARTLLRECQTDGSGYGVVRIQEDGRQVQTIQPASAAVKGEAQVTLREKGAYLVSGGSGGLGFILAKHLAKKCKARILLTGRSKFTKAVRKKMKAIKNAGGDAQYLQTDVTDVEAMHAAIEKCESLFGGLNGVLHCAGVLRDKLFFNLSMEEFDEVLQPKVQGTMVLDRVTATKELDFIMLFSSVSAVTGNEGQAAYSAANGFLDGFATWRNDLVANGERHGRTLSVNWPLWQDGGMAVEAETQAAQAAVTGMTPMSTESGIAAFHWVLEQGLSQTIPLTGDIAKIDALFGLEPRRPAAPKPVQVTAIPPVYEAPLPTPAPQAVPAPKVAKVTAAPKVDIDPNQLSEAARTFLSKIVGQALQADPTTIDANEPFSDYGVDSFLTLKIIRQLEKDFGRLPKTLMFENFNVEDLVGYFTKHHHEALSTKLGFAAITVEPPQAAPVAPAPAIQTAVAPSAPAATIVIDDHALKSKASEFLCQIVSQALQAEPGSVDPAEPFSDYGVDSFLTLKIIRQLEKDFGRLPKTLMFENFNVDDLVAYFSANHRETLAKKLGLATEVQSTPAPVPTTPPATSPVAQPKVVTPALVEVDEGELIAKTQAFLADVVAAALQMDATRVDASEPFNDYGVDSFLTLKIIRQLEKDFGRLPKTLMFENFNVDDLVGYFSQNHRDILLERFGLASPVPQAVQVESVAPIEPAPPEVAPPSVIA